MSARYIGAEKFREGKGIVAGIADSNLPEPLHGTGRQMKKFLLSRFTHWVCPPSVIRLFHVSTPVVLRWARNFAECVYEKPEPGEVAVAGPDEMWRFLKSKKQTKDITNEQWE